MTTHISPSGRRRHLVGALLALCLAAGAAACGSDDSSADDPTADVSTATETAETAEPAESADSTVATAPEPATTGPSDAATFPVTIDHAFGSTVIEAEPTAVISASGTMTGHLLAIEAPVVAAQVLPPTSPLSDDNGFLLQWADVAVADGVVAIPGPEVNIEAIAAQNPDLIVGNSFGGDAVTEDVYALLSEIAPTIVIDHSGMEWQELALILADATGRQAEADATIADFDAHVAEIAPTLDTSNEVVTGVITESGINMFTSESAHGKLIAALGLTLHEITGGALEGEAGAESRTDVVSVSAELIPDAFDDSSVLFVFAEQADIDTALELYPTLGVTPAATEERMYPLGVESFRLDMYSATLVADRIAAQLAS
ncbi:MAG: Fe2+-enterobactin ABC transporter substrate-binding protein [Ilumatobacteraceae bacterium]